MDALGSDIKFLPGVGPKRAELLKNELGISTFGELIRLYPFRYIDRSSLQRIADVRPDLAYVVRPYRGGWMEACAMYRDWVRTLPGFDHPPARPAWMRDAPVALIYPVQGEGLDHGTMVPNGYFPYANVLPHVARYAGFYIGIDRNTATVEQFSANMSKIQMIIQICAAIGMFGAMIFLPKLFKKFEYRTLMISSCLIGFASSVVTLLVGWFTKNLMFCIPFMIISAIPLGVINNVSGAMVFDCIDYMEWQTGHRDNALGSACQSFVNKLGNAFATVMIIAMYLIVKIDPKNLNAADPSAALSIANSMTAGQNFGMYALVSIVPGISLLLCAIPLFFYDIVGDKKKKITEELAVMRKERGIEISD